MTAKLDRAALKKALTDALQESWKAFRDEHSDHRVYGLGLYTAPLTEYVGMTIFSEEGLEEVARSYAQRSGRELEQESTSLRWSPADSPHHMWREDLFEEAQALLDAGPDPYSYGAASVTRVSDALESFVAALRAFEEEGNLGDSRRGMILCLWMGDQSDEDRIAYARRLNPPEDVERFATEIELGNEAFLEG